jgi:hypothetical protein
LKIPIVLVIKPQLMYSLKENTFLLILASYSVEAQISSIEVSEEISAVEISTEEYVLDEDIETVEDYIDDLHDYDVVQE